MFAKDVYGKTPLHMSCQGGFLDVIQLLASKGANVHEATVDGQKPPLCVVCEEQGYSRDLPIAL